MTDRPSVVWFPGHTVDAVDQVRLSQAFERHLRASFAVDTKNSEFGPGAVRIDNDFDSRLDTGGCRALIEDTLNG